MTAEANEIDAARAFLREPPHLVADTLRYGAAMALVLTVTGGLAVAIGHVPVHSEVSEAESATLVDLPPAEASSRPVSEAADAAQATAAQPRRVEAQAKPNEPPKPDPPEKVKEEPPPAPAPAAPLERKAEPPKPVEALPPAPAQAAQAPAEASTHADTDDSSGDEGTPHASAHKITLWQKALMRRLEAAKRTHHRALTSAGTVKVAFEIDRQGAVHAAHVTTGSGSPALDGAAVQLVKDASPFPAPPADAGAKDLSFVVPIHFKR